MLTLQKNNIMIESILIVLGLLHFTDALFEKWNVWEAIAQFGSKSKHKFIFDLCFCRLCLMFHISWIITFLYCCLTSFSFDLAIVPFTVGGITYLIQKK